MVRRGEHFIPDVIIIGEGISTNVIIKGTEFGNCISDLEYSARDKDGNLNPTVSLIGVYVDKFKPRDGSDTFMRLQRMFENQKEEAVSGETETASE